MLDAAHDRELSILLGGYVIIYFLWRGDMIKAGGIIREVGPVGSLIRYFTLGLHTMALRCCALSLGAR
jgi:hypothetical protein